MNKNKLWLLLALGTAILLTTSWTPPANDWFPGYIITRDNTRTDGELYRFLCNDDHFFLRASADAKPTKFNNTDVKELGVQESTGEWTIFKARKVGWYLFNKLKFLKKELLVTQIYSSPEVDGFHYYLEHQRSSGGALSSSPRHYYTTRTVAFIVRAPGDDHLILMGEGTLDGKHGEHNLIRDNMKRFSRDYCPAMLKVVDEKRYKARDFEQMLEDYSTACK